MTNRTTIRTLAVVCLGFVPMAALAQGQTLSLQQCLDMAMESNLNVRAGRLSVEQARRQQGTAFDMDKADVTLSQDPSSGGSPDNSISIGQDFDFPTVYFARRSALKAQTEVSRRQLEVTENDIVRQVSSKYYGLLLARQQLQILQRQDSAYQSFARMAAAKYANGAAGKLEQMNAERLLNENRLQVRQAENDYRNAQMEMAVLLNADSPVTPADDSLQPMADDVFSESDDMSLSPLGSLYSAEVTARQKEVRLAAQGFLPGISVSLRNQLLLKGFNPYDIDRERFNKGDFMGFEVGVSIPLFFGGQRAKLRAAKTGLELAKVQREQNVNELNRDYRQAVNECRKAQAAMDYYHGEGMAQADEMARVSQVSYEQGDIDYLEYMQNLREACELRLECAKAVNEYNQSVIKLNYLRGR